MVKHDAHHYNLQDAIININIQTREIYRSKRRSYVSSVFWHVYLILSMVLFVREGVNDIIYFYSSPVTMIISEDFNSTLDFPSIGLCANNPYTFKMQKASNITSMEEILFLMTSLAIPPPYLNNIDRSKWETFAKHHAARKTLPPQHYFREYGMTARESIANCFLRGVELNCLDYVEASFFSGNQQCFMMFQYKTISQNMPGVSGSFTLHLLSKESGLVNRVDSPLKFSWSLWLIAPQTEQSSGYTSPQPMPLGKHVQVRIKKVVNKRLHSRQHPCTNTRSRDKMDQSTVESCLWSCEAEIAYKECGCVRFGTNVLQYKHPLCQPGDQAMCAYNVSKYFTCDCSIVYCTSVEYQADIMTREDVAKGAMEVELYYSKLSTMVTEQIPAVALSTILGNLGGQASLLLGIRLATFVQLIYYCVRSCYDKLLRQDVIRIFAD